MSKKKFAVGQKVTLTDTVEERGFLSAPNHTHEKGTVGWIVNGGHLLCNGRYLRLDAERVEVSGFDPEEVALFLWHRLTCGQDELEWFDIHREQFLERIEAALYKLNFPVPFESDQPAEITFDDLSKHQFWQGRQDLIKMEED